MAKDANLSIRVDADIKEKSEEILKKLGISMSSAINIFLNQIILRQGLPFDVKISEPIYEEDLTKEEIIELIEKTSDDKKYSLNDLKNIVKVKFKI